MFNGTPLGMPFRLPNVVSAKRDLLARERSRMGWFNRTLRPSFVFTLSEH
jgi:hypothetical protein